MEAFVYQALPQRVVFGFGTLAGIAQEIDRLGCSRAIVLATPQQEASARDKKTERLRALRLAKEAANPAPLPQKRKKK